MAKKRVSVRLVAEGGRQVRAELEGVAKEVWSRMGLALDAAFANMATGWEGLKASGLSALEGIIAGVVSSGDRTAAIFQGGLAVARLI